MYLKKNKSLIPYYQCAKFYVEFCQSRTREAGRIGNDLKVIASQKIGLGGCTIVHKFAQFLKQRFFYAAPALAGPGGLHKVHKKRLV